MKLVSAGQSAIFIYFFIFFITINTALQFEKE